ncbi:MAG: COQ9 family protein [Paracoccaceae bacterium]
MTDDALDKLLNAALAHVAFDGWSEATFRAAIADSDVDPALARGLCPRGAVDLALAYHRRGDRVMQDRLEQMDLGALRIRDRIIAAVRTRMEAIDDKEAVRRGATLFALPMYAPDGAKAIWNTCDLIWTAVGDTSTDGNWYSKRAILSGVYSSTVLFWLGDDSPDRHATWDFLDRRIEDVMRFEKVKAKVNDNPLLKPFLAGPNWVMSRMKAPERQQDMPGSV